MQTVTMYEADDGKQFRTEALCLEYSPAAVRKRMEAASKPLRREIKQLEGQKRRLENMLFAAGRMEQAPCFVCGYNGPGYYQPGQHRCAARHHKLRLRA